MFGSADWSQMQIDQQFRCDEVSPAGYRKLPPRAVDTDCINCGNTFSFVKVGAGRLRQVCSKVCKRAYRIQERRRLWQEQQPKPFSCQKCKSTFFSKQTKACYCSAACMAAGVAGKLEARAVASTHRACEKCGELFRPYRPSRDQKRRGQFQRFCSAACGLRVRSTPTQKRKTGALRKSRRSVGFDPLAVLDRDGWHCHLCGRPTPKHLRGTTDLRAPEVDHIDPIAAGGKHEMINAACACRKCNLEKGATPKGQLRLFG